MVAKPRMEVCFDVQASTFHFIGWKKPATSIFTIYVRDIVACIPHKTLQTWLLIQGKYQTLPYTLLHGMCCQIKTVPDDMGRIGRRKS
jgi:hypothetical protein